MLAARALLQKAVKGVKEMAIDRYPLTWPEGWKRTAPSARKSAQFAKMGRGWTGTAGTSAYDGKKNLSVADGLERIAREIRALGVSEHTVIVSTNIPVRLDGLPRSGMSEPADPGVAVYWRAPKYGGPEKCLAIDRYNRVADNLAAIAATLEALRAIERHGGGEILDRAFQGFTALPMPKGRSWREVLGISPERPIVSADTIREIYTALARVRHPDATGGSHEAFIELTEARDAGLREVGAIGVAVGR